MSDVSAASRHERQLLQLGGGTKKRNTRHKANEKAIVKTLKTHIKKRTITKKNNKNVT